MGTGRGRRSAALTLALATAGLLAGCQSAAKPAADPGPAAHAPADSSFGADLRVAKRPNSDTPRHLRRGGGTNC